MHRSTFLFVLILVIFTAVLGYNYFFQPFAYFSAPQDDSTIQEAPSISEAEIRAQTIAKQLEAMSTEEKIAQLFLVPIQLEFSQIKTQTQAEVQATQSAQSTSASQSAKQSQANPASKSAQLASQATSASKSAQLASQANPASKSAQLASQATSASKSAQLASQAMVDEFGLNPDIYNWLSTFKPGGILLFGTKLDFFVSQEVIAKLQATQDQVTQDQVTQDQVTQDQVTPNPSLLMGVDHEGGTVQRLSGRGFTVLPSWKEQCAQPLADGQILWEKSAKELKEVGISLIFAPVVDFALNHPSLKTRVCSDDLEKVIAFAKEYYQSFVEAGVQPVFKHFPGIGKTKVDLHTEFESVTVGADEATVYQTLADNLAGTQFAVMSSHAGVTNQFEKVPCSQSEACVKEIYAVSPNALVFSDALEMKAALQVNNSIQEASRLAVQAGNSFLVYGPSVTTQEIEEIHTYLVAQYIENSLFRAKVDSAVQRILEFKLAQAS